MLRHIPTSQPRREASFELELDGPLDPAASLEMFRRSGDDLLDRWDGRTFLRTVAVNGRAFSPDVLKAAVRDGKDSGPAVELIVENTGFYKVIKLDYHGGERYPQLERVSSVPDRLDDILKPEAK